MDDTLALTPASPNLQGRQRCQNRKGISAWAQITHCLERSKDDMTDRHYICSTSTLPPKPYTLNPTP